MNEDFLDNIKNMVKNLYNSLKELVSYLYKKLKPYFSLWNSKEFRKSYFIYFNTKNTRIRNKHGKKLKVLYSNNGLIRCGGIINE